MEKNLVGHRRRSIRLKDFDYSSAGAYFVTIVCHKRMNIFGSIQDGVVYLNRIGKIIEKAWTEIPLHYPYVEAGTHVIMPNHFHGILIIDSVEATHVSPLPVKRQPLGIIIGSFKSAVTKRVHNSGLFTQDKFWQRNYYDHIIRDDEDYQKIYEYIDSNPINWEFDKENVAI